MTDTLTPPQRPGQPGSHAVLARTPRGSDHNSEIDLREWLMTLWEGRYLVLACLLTTLVLGTFYLWRSVPIYQAEALLQIEPPKMVRDSDAAFARMENLFSAPSDAPTEIEILGSNLVLGRTVEALNLDLVAQPILFPVIGEALVRGKADAPFADVGLFELPDHLRGHEFQLIAMADGSFTWKTPLTPPTASAKPGVSYPPDQALATGRPGDILVGTYGGESLKLQLRRLIAKPGQKFRLYRRTMLGAILDIRNDLEAAEKGVTQQKSTNLLALSFRHPNAMKAAEILNEVMNQYLRQNAQRKSDEIARTLQLLQQQLPEIHSKLEAAENNLNQFRAHSGSVDIPREAEIALQQSSSLATQISSLKQKKQELLRIYQEDSDVVSTLNAQIAKLEGEAAAVKQKVRSLPSTQQELVRLARDVQVNTELYTALRNNIQQIQVTRSGAGNNRVVDVAMPGLKPIKPKKEMLMAVFLLLGLFLGVGLVLAREVLQSGIKDHRIIESKLGLPVFVTIPHSKCQEDHHKAMDQSQPGSHLLALHEPEDLATESLRSLRTMLSFTLGDTPNRAIMITGPSPKVGKSFISSNFSVVLAQNGLRVLVVDADMRRGNLHKYFGLRNRMGGLSEVITGQVDWKSVLHKTEIPGLDLISSGRIPKNPAELLMSQGFSALLTEAGKAYDYVVIDAPPLLPVTDATIIGSRVGSVLLVAKYGQHQLDEIRTCQSRLESSGIPLKGCVFNDLMPTGLGYYDQRYRYAYHYKYSQT
jgi:tyrosine-protein kinase Etk/Wzc